MESVISEHIEITPGVCGGKPRIAGVCSKFTSAISFSPSAKTRQSRRCMQRLYRRYDEELSIMRLSASVSSFLGYLWVLMLLSFGYILFGVGCISFGRYLARQFHRDSLLVYGHS
jgi:hypothetical protein